MEELLFGRRYRAIERIGTGGMADVYRAVDETLGRTVAVKVMHARFAADPEFTARFRQEAQAAANLVNPTIVNIYDWGQDGDTYYIVMEYVRGSDLKHIEREGALSSARVAEIGVQVCSALSVAHGYDVIHRDIKPHNIMVQPDGSVKVMDFGIARAGNTTMTQAGSVLGTAQYVSPEQALGKPLTAASDLYSLGVVLYEAATGRLPFDADTPVAVALMQVNETAVAPHEVNPAIDPALEAVIVKAMQKRTEDRYVSADELKRDLRVVVQGRPGDIATAGAGAAAGAVGAAGEAAGAGAAAGAAGTVAFAGVGAVSATTVMPSADTTSVMTPADSAVAAQALSETAVIPPASGAGAGGRSERMDRAAKRAELSRAGERRSVWPWVLAAVLIALAGYGVASSRGLIGSGRGVPVPDVSAKSAAVARSTIESAGLTMGKVTETFGPRAEMGLVTSQTPAPSVKAEKGSVVALIVGKGPEMAAVPDVVGKTEADAFKMLKDAGFSPQALPSEYNNDVPANTVVRQKPDGEVSAVKYSVVNYVLSRGPDPRQFDSQGKSDKSKGRNNND